MGLPASHGCKGRKGCRESKGCPKSKGFPEKMEKMGIWDRFATHAATVEGEIRARYAKAAGRDSVAKGHNEGRDCGNVIATRREPGGNYRTARDARGALSQNGKGAYDGGNAEELSVEREETRANDAADDEVCRHASSAHKKSVGAAGGSVTRGRTAKDSASEYSVAHVDGSKRGSKRGADIAGDIDGDAR